MSGLEMLDVLIGLMTIYLVLSLVCSAVAEFIVQIIRLRGIMLRRGIRQLLSDDVALLKSVYEHPLVEPLHGDRGVVGMLLRLKSRDASYIPPEAFAGALLDLVVREGDAAAPVTSEQVRRRLKQFQEAHPPTARALVLLFDQVAGDNSAFKTSIGNWFSQKMERVSGEFRRWMQAVLIFLGFVIAVVANADTIGIVNHLADDPEARRAAVEVAEKVAQLPPPASVPSLAPADRTSLPGSGPAGVGDSSGTVAGITPTGADEAVRLAGEIEPLIGSHAGKAPMWSMPWWIGIILTAIALSLGAPFWFNTLQKLMQIRQSVKPQAPDMTLGESARDEKGGSPSPGSGSGGASPSGASAGPKPTPASEDALLVGLKGFRVATTEHCIENAYWLARASQLAYSTTGKTLRSDLSTWSLTQSEFLDAGDVAGDRRKSTQAFIASNREMVIVAFRGTESDKPGDVVTDADFRRRPWAHTSIPGQVHLGFHDALDVVWKQTVEILKSLRGQEQSIWLTGHSLGGALAMLAAARLLAEEPRITISGLYTFGQPRGGDAEFIDWFQRRMPGGYFRYINHRDAVPRVPLRTGGYCECGSVRYFDRFGRLHQDPGMWFRMLDTLTFNNLQEARAKFKEPVQDHSIDDYVSLVSSQRPQGSA